MPPEATNSESNTRSEGPARAQQEMLLNQFDRMYNDPALFAQLLTEHLNQMERERPVVPGQPSVAAPTPRWAVAQTAPHEDQMAPFFNVLPDHQDNASSGIDLANATDRTVISYLDSIDPEKGPQIRRIVIDPMYLPEFLIQAIADGYKPHPIELAQWKMKAQHFYKTVPQTLRSGQKTSGKDLLSPKRIK